MKNRAWVLVLAIVGLLLAGCGREPDVVVEWAFTDADIAESTGDEEPAIRVMQTRSKSYRIDFTEEEAVTILLAHVREAGCFIPDREDWVVDVHRYRTTSYDGGVYLSYDVSEILLKNYYDAEDGAREAYRITLKEEEAFDALLAASTEEWPDEYTWASILGGTLHGESGLHIATATFETLIDESCD